MKQIYSNGLINPTEIYYLSQVNKSTETYIVSNTTNIPAILQVSDNLINWSSLATITDTQEIQINKPFIRLISNSLVYIKYQLKDQTIQTNSNRKTNEESYLPDLSIYLEKSNLSSEISKLLGFQPEQFKLIIHRLLKSVDTDKDTLSDFDEILLHNTNPDHEDSDLDGYKDAVEILVNTDPNSNLSKPTLTIDGLTIFEPINKHINIMPTYHERIVVEDIPAKIVVHVGTEELNFESLQKIQIDMSEHRGLVPVDVRVTSLDNSITVTTSFYVLHLEDVQVIRERESILSALAVTLEYYFQNLETPFNESQILIANFNAPTTTDYSIVFSTDDLNEEIPLFSPLLYPKYILSKVVNHIDIHIKDNLTQEKKLIKSLQS